MPPIGPPESKILANDISVFRNKLNAIEMYEIWRRFLINSVQEP